LLRVTDVHTKSLAAEDAYGAPLIGSDGIKAIGRLFIASSDVVVGSNEVNDLLGDHLLLLDGASQWYPAIVDVLCIATLDFSQQW
jgi:hypothetical protein